MFSSCRGTWFLTRNLNNFIKESVHNNIQNSRTCSSNTNNVHTFFLFCSPLFNINVHRLKNVSSSDFADSRNIVFLLRYLENCCRTIYFLQFIVPKGVSQTLNILLFCYFPQYVAIILIYFGIYNRDHIHVCFCTFITYFTSFFYNYMFCSLTHFYYTKIIFLLFHFRHVFQVIQKLRKKVTYYYIKLNEECVC